MDSDVVPSFVSDEVCTDLEVVARNGEAEVVVCDDTFKAVQKSCIHIMMVRHDNLRFLQLLYLFGQYYNIYCIVICIKYIHFIPNHHNTFSFEIVSVAAPEIQCYQVIARSIT